MHKDVILDNATKICRVLLHSRQTFECVAVQTCECVVVCCRVLQYDNESAANATDGMPSPCSCLHCVCSVFAEV